MSRTFDGTADMFLADVSGITLPTIISMAGWVKVNSADDGGFSNFFYFTEDNTGVSDAFVRIAGGTANDPIQCGFNNTAGADRTDSVDNGVYDEWMHVGGSGHDSFNRVYAALNGTRSAGTSNTLNFADTSEIMGFGGTRRNGGPSTTHMQGKMAHWAIWSGIELAEEDYAALAAGYSPLTVRPESLWAYFPMQETNTGMAIDVMGTITNMYPETTPPGFDANDNPPVFPVHNVNAFPVGTANHIRRTTPKVIPHADMGSPSAGDMMRLRAQRDYDASANTDDMQLHKLVLWQKGDA